MSWLSSFLHPGRAYDKASQVNQQYFNQATQMRQPFINQGTAAGSQLQNFLKMLSNPEELQAKWETGYKESPHAKDLERTAMDRGLNAASAYGLGGSSAAINNIGNNASEIVNSDRQRYIDDLMKKFMAGIGLGKNIYEVGANTANNGANATQEFGGNQAGLAYGKEQAGANTLGKLGGGALNLLMQYLTGGIGGFPGMSSDMYGGS